MTHDVFISYSSRDKTVADSMCAKLERENIRCWIAPRDVPPGQTWPAALVEAIGHARVFVLILSNGSNNSAQVLREVGEALDKGIPVIPFRIEDVIPSKEMGYYLRGIHWLDAMTPPLERHLNSLSSTLKTLLLAPQSERPPSGLFPMNRLQDKPAGVTPQALRRTRVPLQIVLAFAGFIVLGLIFLLVTRGKMILSSLSPDSVGTTALSEDLGGTLTAIQAGLATSTVNAERLVATPSVSGAASLPGSPISSINTAANWVQVQSFPAPGNAMTGIVRVDDTLWVTVPCDNRIFSLDLEGNLISELAMPEPGCGPGEVGLAWDGTSLWGTWWNEVIQIDPGTGQAISKFTADLDGRSIAWDGSFLWVANSAGSLSVYDLSGRRLRRLAVPVFGVLSGITWADGELLVLDEFGTLTRFDQDLSKIDSYALSGECGISSFHQQMALGLFWDGTSLWVADAVNDRIYQCAPGN
jgi:hypothetical protein